MRALLLVLLPAAVCAAGYNAQVIDVEGAEVARLTDSTRGMEVSVMPSVGNMAYEFKVNGKNILGFPFPGAAEFRQRPALCCIPLMAPWTNGVRDAYFANGKRFVLNPRLLKPGEGPLRGLVMFTDKWKIVSCDADEKSATLVSRLEFWRVPAWMAQFPFAHSITMTYRLADGALEVDTALENHSLDPMPVALGFHPYFTLPGTPRSEWSVHIPAKQVMPVAASGLPTGQRTPMDLPDEHRLGNAEISKVFTQLVAGEDGNAHFRIGGGGQQIDVALGPKFLVAVVYGPGGQNYLNLEPLTGIGNAFELAQSGMYKDLQTIAPGDTWKESFRITPTGF